MVYKKTTEELVAQRPDPQELASRERTPITVVVDNIRSLDNVGMIFRLCELALVEHLYLTGYTGYPEIQNDSRPETMVERHNSRIEKTAVYAVQYQPWTQLPDPVPLVRDFKEQGYQILALEQTDTSISYTKASYTTPTVLIVGHEREGVRPDLLSLADTVIEIPILGIGNSHNVATATGIVLSNMLDKLGKI